MTIDAEWGAPAPLPRLAPPQADARTIHVVRAGDLGAFAACAGGGNAAWDAWIAQAGFEARAGAVLLLPGASGVAGAVFGLGATSDPLVFGALPTALPPGDWRIDQESLARAGFTFDDALLGWCLGAARVRATDAAGPAARLAAEETGSAAGAGLGGDIAAAVILARTLINAPANLLGPTELAAAAARIAARHGARFRLVEGAALEQGFPAIAAVGRGSDRAPCVAAFSWEGSGAGHAAPHVSLVGKGVCFDSGGYDIKPSSGMLRMKKDMGGAAVVLGLAELVMRRDLPVRLELRIGCVENSVSGRAMRPGDVIRTRAGLSVEVNNTDAEGRLVLGDLLAEAAEAEPDLLLDVATLTGAARVALGPDLPALFTPDDTLAEALLAAGRATHDPMWRLPLWDGYADWLESQAADLSNVSSRPMAGAITAAMFLRRFVPEPVRWAHLDAYCWNDRTRPGRPEGGEAPLLRAVYRLLTNLCEAAT